MENATIYEEIRIPRNYTGPGFPTGRFGYHDGARMIWAASERRARLLAREDGFIVRPGTRPCYV